MFIECSVERFKQSLFTENLWKMLVTVIEVGQAQSLLGIIYK